MNGALVGITVRNWGPFTQFTVNAMHRLSPELHMMFYWYLVILSPMFDVKYKESFSYRVLVTEKFGNTIGDIPCSLHEM